MSSGPLTSNLAVSAGLPESEEHAANPTRRRSAQAAENHAYLFLCEISFCSHARRSTRAVFMSVLPCCKVVGFSRHILPEAAEKLSDSHGPSSREAAGSHRVGDLRTLAGRVDLASGGQVVCR